MRHLFSLEMKHMTWCYKCKTTKRIPLSHRLPSSTQLTLSSLIFTKRFFPRLYPLMFPYTHVKIKTLQSHACISQIQQLILLLILNPACKLCVSICSHNILHNLIVLENQFCHKIIFTDMFGTIIQARMHCMGPCI